MKNERKHTPTELRTCEICGAVVQSDYLKADDPWAVIWVCEDCRLRVPPREIQRLVQEVVLRGVPFS